MQNLLTWHYWFNLRPEPFLPHITQSFFVFLIILLILSVFSAIKQKQKGLYRNFWKRFYMFSLSNLAIGAILLFFNYESAAFLSSRFWLSLWLVTMALWLWPMIKGLRLIPANKKKLEQEQKFKKYIP
jgi:small-conductance mechanosensitive channel